MNSDGRMEAPWRDLRGNVIREGDTIEHPDGLIGFVIRDPHGSDSHNQWLAVYTDGFISSLLVQIGDKGKATVRSRDCPYIVTSDEGTSYCSLAVSGHSGNGGARFVVPDENSDEFELIAESVHNAWWTEKQRQGKADNHPDAIPYQQLSDQVKEYDRATARTVLKAVRSLNDNQHGYTGKPAKTGEPDRAAYCVYCGKAVIYDTDQITSVRQAARFSDPARPGE